MNYYAVATSSFDNLTGFSLEAVIDLLKETIISVLGMQLTIITEWWPYIVGYVVITGVFYIAGLGMRKKL